MNTPIIDPMIFYYIEMANRLFNMPLYFGLITLITFLLLIMIFSDNDNISDEKATRITKRIMIPMMVLEIVFIAVSFFIPSTETIYKMLIVEQITPANIESFGYNVNEMLDTLAEKVIYIGKELK